MEKIIVISQNDNVATALTPLAKGEKININIENLKSTIILKENIPFAHKLSIKTINKNDKIYKYGEVIGKAENKICKGYHVHTHNISSIRDSK